jgi:transcriptional repressor NrdR
VVKRDKRREEYQRAKVLAGLRKAFEKRPFSQEDIERIADNVEAKIFDRNEREIASTQIGSIIMDELEGVDGVAYVRFASVYRKFEDVSEFMKELKDILDGKEQAGRKKR